MAEADAPAPDTKKKKNRWRPKLRALHRDIGYAVAALCLAYAISGLAVNHIEDWNPNYTFENEKVNLGALPQGDYQAMQDFVVQSLDINPKTVKGHFMETETTFRVFLDDTQEVSVDVRDGKGLYKRITTRTGLYEVNALHLNSIKGIWTWVADIFAVLLIFLTLTGIFMMKGKHSLARRGKWYFAAGVAVPIGFIWFSLYGA